MEEFVEKDRGLVGSDVEEGDRKEVWMEGKIMVEVGVV